MWPVCGKFLVVLVAIAAILGFGYHLYHNLREAHGGHETRPTSEVPAQLRKP